MVFEPDATARGAVARALQASGVVARLEVQDLAATNPTATLDSCLADCGHRSTCLWIDVDGGARPVLDGATDYLARQPRVVVVTNPAREDPSSLQRLAQTWRLYLHDVRARRLIRMPGDNPHHIQGMLDASWIDAGGVVLLPADRDRAWRPL